MMTADTKFWDAIAEKYAASPVANPTAFQRKQAITRQHLSPDSSVLEIGCGTGTLALAMSPFAGHILAVDFSAEMLRIADAKKQNAGVHNVTFQRGTLDDLSARDHDTVWAFSILHLVPDRPRFLARLFELLEPGGTFVSSNACLGDSMVPYGALIGLMRLFGKAPSVHIYDRKTILREMSEAGFTQIAEHDVGAPKTIAFVVAKKPS